MTLELFITLKLMFDYEFDKFRFFIKLFAPKLSIFYDALLRTKYYVYYDAEIYSLPILDL